jgi:hypothetical protein
MSVTSSSPENWNQCAPKEHQLLIPRFLHVRRQRLGGYLTRRSTGSPARPRRVPTRGGGRRVRRRCIPRSRIRGRTPTDARNDREQNKHHDDDQNRKLSAENEDTT